MHQDEHDELWTLLGKARPVEASPFFSRNVLRTLRQERQEMPGLLGWFTRRWTLVAAGGCAAVIAALCFFPKAEKADPVQALAEQVTASPDYQVIEHLDELLNTQANLVWLESSAY